MNYSNLRKELIDHLRSLGDSEYQKKCWVEHICPNGIVHDEMDYAIHFLYDDTNVAKTPRSYLGNVFINEEEIEAIQRVINSINRLFQTYGTRLDDEEYISKPEWEDVLAASTDAYRLLTLSTPPKQA